MFFACHSRVSAALGTVRRDAGAACGQEQEQRTWLRHMNRDLRLGFSRLFANAVPVLPSLLLTRSAFASSLRDSRRTHLLTQPDTPKRSERTQQRARPAFDAFMAPPMTDNQQMMDPAVAFSPR